MGEAMKELPHSYYGYNGYYGYSGRLTEDNIAHRIKTGSVLRISIQLTCCPLVQRQDS
jgi:hypothetical protein